MNLASVEGPLERGVAISVALTLATGRLRLTEALVRVVLRAVFFVVVFRGEAARVAVAFSFVFRTVAFFLVFFFSSAALLDVLLTGLALDLVDVFFREAALARPVPARFLAAAPPTLDLPFLGVSAITKPPPPPPRSACSKKAIGKTDAAADEPP